MHLYRARIAMTMRMKTLCLLQATSHLCLTPKRVRLSVSRRPCMRPLHGMPRIKIQHPRHARRSDRDRAKAELRCRACPRFGNPKALAISHRRASSSRHACRRHSTALRPVPLCVLVLRCLQASSPRSDSACPRAADSIAATAPEPASCHVCTSSIAPADVAQAEFVRGHGSSIQPDYAEQGTFVESCRVCRPTH